MKLPRDISGESLILALRTLEYQVTRQKGSHIRLTTKPIKDTRNASTFSVRVFRLKDQPIDLLVVHRYKIRHHSIRP